MHAAPAAIPRAGRVAPPVASASGSRASSSSPSSSSPRGSSSSPRAIARRPLHAAPPRSRGGVSPAPLRAAASLPGRSRAGRALPRDLSAPRRDPSVRAADGDTLGAIAEYAGAALAVVAVAFAAGAASREDGAGGDGDNAPTARKTSPASSPKPPPASGKQTIAGAVAGANNAAKKQKPIPGLPAKPAAAFAASAAPAKKKPSLGGGGVSGGGILFTFGGDKDKASYAPYDWGAADATGPREYMEDAWAVRSSGFAGGYLFASVMDGHGGAASSAYLRENLFDALDKGARQTPSHANPPAPGEAPDGTAGGGYLAEALKSAYDQIDERLINHIARLGEPECWSGSTCTTVLVRPDRVVAANVGDSRAILVREGGKGVELTSDHRPVGSNTTGRQELDRVTRAGAWSVGGRVCGILAVSRAFGDYEFKGGRFDLLDDLSEEPLAKKATMASPPVVPTPAVFECAIEEGRDEWLVLASDGLWDTVNTIQCATFVKQETAKKPDIDAEGLAEALVKRAIRFRTQDNVAVVCVDLRPKAKGGSGA